jgi:hypothetical protein
MGSDRRSARPVFTFFSDGNHATVVGSNPFLVSIRDSFFGTITTGALVPLRGTAT